MSFDFLSISVCLIVLAFLILTAKVFKNQIKWVLKFAIDFVVSGAMILLFNTVFAFSGFCIALNPLNALIVAVLGVPGFLVIELLTHI